MKIYRSRIVVLVFIGLFLSGCSSPPSVSEAKHIIKQQIKNESKGKMKLLSFRKTNSVKREYQGRKLYQLEYEAEIEFLEDCKWLTASITSSSHRNFRTAQTKSQAEAKGGYWAGFRNGIQPGTNQKKGERVKYNGSLTFEKTENGWRPLQ